MIHKNAKELVQFKKDLVDLIGAHYPDALEDQVYQDMLFNVGLLREERLDMAEIRLLNTAFKELRYALKIFKPYRLVPKAAVFGSARTPIDHASFKLAKEFGRKLVKKGWMIITGGASGIMEAAMIGAGSDKSFGLNILLPFEQDANPVIKGNQKLIFFKYFFTRKLMFLKESQATVLFPGGFGTFDEGFESFTLVQTGKAKPRPLVLLDAPESSYWRSTLKLLKRNFEGDRLISKHDLALIRHFQDPDKGADELVRFYVNYDSSRFLKDRYLIRIRKKLKAQELEKINKDFKDILSGGAFERMADLTDDDNKDPSLDRLVFHFDKSNYARLRLLIDHLNSL